MKPLIIVSALVLGVLIGNIGGINRPKPTSIRILIVILIALSLFLTIAPPIAAPAGMAETISFNGRNHINVAIDINDAEYSNDRYLIKTADNEQLQLITDSKYQEITHGNKIIANVDYIAKNELKLLSIESTNPLIYYSFIPMLLHKVKLINLHVPVAWVSVLSYLVSMIYSFLFLKKRNINYDINARTAASLGTLFAILATTTGMIWAKYTWGSYWNWDPRETSIFVLLLIYLAYFALRQSINNEDARARLSSVYLIIAFFAAVFLVFVMPRMFSGLHPGSAGDVTIGPALSSDKSMLGGDLLYTFALSMMSFTMLYFWILNISTRMNKILYNKGLLK